jgi:hypothetical protein
MPVVIVVIVIVVAVIPACLVKIVHELQKKMF